MIYNGNFPILFLGFQCFSILLQHDSPPCDEQTDRDLIGSFDGFRGRMSCWLLGTRSRNYDESKEGQDDPCPGGTVMIPCSHRFHAFPT